jgi:hypothetical protein
MLASAAALIAARWAEPWKGDRRQRLPVDPNGPQGARDSRTLGGCAYGGGVIFELSR